MRTLSGEIGDRLDPYTVCNYPFSSLPEGQHPKHAVYGLDPSSKQLALLYEEGASSFNQLKCLNNKWASEGVAEETVKNLMKGRLAQCKATYKNMACYDRLFTDVALPSDGAVSIFTEMLSLSIQIEALKSGVTCDFSARICINMLVERGFNAYYLNVIVPLAAGESNHVFLIATPQDVLLSLEESSLEAINKASGSRAWVVDPWNNVLFPLHALFGHRNVLKEEAIFIGLAKIDRGAYRYLKEFYKSSIKLRFDRYYSSTSASFSGGCKRVYDSIRDCVFGDPYFGGATPWEKDEL